MRRNILAGVIALLAAMPLCVAAKPVAAPHLVQLSPAPGIALSVSRDWMGCDDATARSLGARRDPDTFKQVCQQFIEGGTHTALIYPSLPYILVAQMKFVPGFAIPETFLQTATPETLQFLKDRLCTDMSKHDPNVSNCDVRIETVGGRLVYEARFRIGGKTVVRLYFLPGDGGTLNIAFYAFAAAQAAADARTDAVLASVVLNAPPAPEPETVKLQAAPGVSVSVPKNWIACDDANDALLGGAKDTESLKGSVCAVDTADTTLTVFDPHPYRTMTLRFIHDPRQIDGDMFLRDLAPDKLVQQQDENCQAATKPLVASGVQIAACVVSATTVSGRPARQIVVTGTENGPQKLRMEYRAYQIAYDKGYLQIDTETPAVFKPVTGLEADPILNSVTIE
jgi:hypothetical protein